MSIETEEWRDPEFRIPLFQQGSFKLNSGALSTWKLECDSLTDQDWDGVAAMVRQLISGPFSEVEGVPTGGLKLAERLRPFAQTGVGPKLIVDDVLTTGGSLERHRQDWAKRLGVETGRAGQPFIAVVLFARGQCPWWVKAIFSMPEVFWLSPTMRG